MNGLTTRGVFGGYFDGCASAKVRYEVNLKRFVCIMTRCSCYFPSQSPLVSYSQLDKARNPLFDLLIV